MFTPESTTLRFTEDGGETQSAIAAETDALIRSHRANPRLRVLIAGNSLQVRTIAALISALRKLREVGGALELRAENKTVRRIILLHGLERVFEFPPVPPASAAGRHARNPIARAIARTLGELGALMGRSPVPLRDPLWMIW